MFEYIQDELGEELSSGRLIATPDSEPFFFLLGGQFPIGHHRIAWEKVKDKHCAEVLAQPRMIGSDELREMLLRYREVVRGWLSGIDSESRVVWIGDMTEPALEMSKHDLLAHFHVLFSFPQHSYALPRDASWCLNYVMEGELFFARAPARDESNNR